MWRDADRSTYRQVGNRLPRGLTDPEWGPLVPLILPGRPGGLERTFSWVGRNRRLAKDYENSLTPSWLSSHSPASRSPSGDFRGHQTFE